MARAKLIELFKRSDDYVKSDNIHINGSDNNYPERLKLVINNSITAKSCTNKLTDFLYGGGFELGQKIVNKKKKHTLNDLALMACQDVAEQYYFALHVNYDAEGVVNYLDVLPAEGVRKSKNDDLGYGGLIYYSKKWGEQTENIFSQKNKTEAKYFYPYNPDINVINEQRNKDTPKGDLIEKVKNYRGQVLFVSCDKRSIYPLSLIDPVYNDCDTEYRISTLRNNKLRSGFIETTIVMMRDQSEDEDMITDNELKGLLGTENQSNVLKVVVKTDGDEKLEDALHIKTVSAPLDKELFADWVANIEDNIINACKQIPKILVKSGDGALFGTNAESMEKAKEFYIEQTKRERKIIENAFATVLGIDNLKLIEIGQNGESNN